MPWQKVVDHVSYGAGGLIMVESKSGNQYPVTIPSEHVNDHVYTHMVSENDWDLWADVDFSGDGPTTDRISTGSPYGGVPREEAMY